MTLRTRLLARVAAAAVRMLDAARRELPTAGPRTAFEDALQAHGEARYLTFPVVVPPLFGVTAPVWAKRRAAKMIGDELVELVTPTTHRTDVGNAGGAVTTLISYDFVLIVRRGAL